MATSVSVSPDGRRLGAPDTGQDSGVLSGLDSQLFQCLQADGRAPYSALARKLGVSEVTVRRRVARLIEDGVPPERIRHDRQVDQSGTADAATAELLRHEERDPAELGAFAPLTAIEPVSRVAQPA